MGSKHYAFYNEIDPYCVSRLKLLMKQGLIMDGEVDSRSIKDVTKKDLKGFTRAHFFAGIGGWDFALGLAGWPEDRPVWTGSCPCQPFSTAGKGEGYEDPRDLWPVWERLIGESAPDVVLGEQVEKAIAFGWLDRVYRDLEARGYALGSAIIPGVCVNAPHKRDRIWFVGDSEYDGQDASKISRRDAQAIQRGAEGQNGAQQFARTSASRALSGQPLADRDGEFAEGRGASGARGIAKPANGGKGRPADDTSSLGWGEGRHDDGEDDWLQPNAKGKIRGSGKSLADAARHDAKRRPSKIIQASGGSQGDDSWMYGLSSDAGMLADRDQSRREGRIRRWTHQERQDLYGHFRRSGSVSPWSTHEWIICGDGKARRVPTIESGICLLAYGLPGRVARIKSAGNAIIPQVAAEFIGAFMDIKGIEAVY